MSQFLNRVSKLSRHSDSLIQRINFRLFSSSLARRLPPYFILDKNPFGDGDGDNIDFDFLDLPQSKLIRSEKKVPWGLLEARGTIGASRGWVATLKKGVVCLQDDLNLSASDSNPKRISLPRLVTLPHCQIQIVTNLAMSSSSPFDDDCVVAVKFLGPQLSLCRPAHDTKWTNIKIKDPSFFTSHVMFSQRDQLFSLPASGGNHMGSWDLLKHKGKPKLQKLHFQNLPTLKKELSLVQSSAGETFLVFWYRSVEHYMPDAETKGFRVFLVDQEGNATYTEDIGDLCIFLSKSEPFCLPSSSFPGLERNYIY